MSSLNGLTLDQEGHEIRCHGHWTVNYISELRDQIKSISMAESQPKVIQCGEIDILDSAGALLLHQLSQSVSTANADNVITGLNPNQQSLMDVVSQNITAARSIQSPPSHNVIHRLGVFAVEKIMEFMAFMAFIGEMMVLAVHGLLHPHRLPWRDFVAVLEETGFRALGIIALMMFLIGIVTAYQLAVQLRQYGANIFIVDTTGIAILREFAPLITAVIMAGRTSTAFAALIGTMIVNEEVDALRTMGVQPVLRLVIPRVLGLMIALPLLTVWADVFGIMGSMFMSNAVLDINYETYLTRFNATVGLVHYMLGLVKSPVFAIVIASIGCFQGFSVKMSAESVGQQTTKAAVQTIFIIIIVDAVFSILYNVMGL